MIDLDGTENKSKLGANGILAVSLAVARVRAAARLRAVAVAVVSKTLCSMGPVVHRDMKALLPPFQSPAPLP